MKPLRISSRKQEHVELTIGRDVSFQTKTPGFERWEFQHNALPELDFSEVDPSTKFLGKPLSLPLLISSMTGGYGDATRINRQLAEVCAEKQLAMGVGSQRQAIHDTQFHRSFSVVREVAPDIPVFGNIGGAEVAKLKDASAVLRLADLIRADAFAVHLNPLQEFLQPEGNPEFRGVLKGIAMLVRDLPIPVIVKEIGAGISLSVAKRLLDAGVSIIDIAGAGGTSWAGVEIIRRAQKKGKRSKTSGEGGPLARSFWDWGIPTVDCLRQVCSLKVQSPSLTVIASGGVTSGLDIAKSIAFGADLAGAARLMLKELETGGTKALLEKIAGWEMELKGAMFLTGSRSIADLRAKQLVLKA
ncbi:MAG: type 2 isopentenyl-diphosphate Delta-isomerase [Ignavibacteriales bacterium]|nr:type 2 isopentenyl-diphosphate Delta-isomerase [Ignavibacteriales bacterium]